MDGEYLKLLGAIELLQRIKSRLNLEVGWRGGTYWTPNEVERATLDTIYKALTECGTEKSARQDTFLGRRKCESCGSLIQ